MGADPPAVGLLRIELSGRFLSRWRGAFSCDALLDHLGMRPRNSPDLLHSPHPTAIVVNLLEPNRENDSRGSARVQPFSCLSSFFFEQPFTGNRPLTENKAQTCLISSS